MNIHLKLFLTYIYCLVFVSVYGQGEGNIWYFGDNAGLDFNSGVPVPLTNGALVTMEGCATICNPDGELLFYTDGITVWNKNHQPMANSMANSPGGQLQGDPSSTQSGVIVPVPLDSLTYYVFTVDNNTGPGGCCYSMVDMSANGGLGDVILASKNTLLFSPSTEKIAAVLHYNGTDIWVIAHPWNTADFYAYLVTASGISSTPVISSAGTVLGASVNNSHGYLKPSPDGSLVCSALEFLNKIEMFHFDKITGQLTFYFSTANNIPDAYGVEFSPNGSILYGSCRWGDALFQWDLSSGTAALILASQTQVATLSTVNGGALQLAPDGKIYLARTYENYLGVINYPNYLGGGVNGCHYQDSVVYLAGKTSRQGLPTFISSYFNPGNFYFSNLCLGDTTLFSMVDPSLVDSVFWNFDDPLSGDNTSTLVDPVHLFSGSGVYDVMLITYTPLQTDTSYQEVQIFDYPNVFLGNDTVVCDGNPFYLDAGNPGCNFLWHNGSTSQMVYVYPADTSIYWVTVSVNQCISYDSITVYSIQNTASIANGNLFCFQDEVSISFTGNASNTATLHWDFGSANIVSGSGIGPYLINYTDTGTYEVSLFVSEGFCFTDTVSLQLTNPSGIGLEISGAGVNCYGESTGMVDLTVTGDYSSYAYIWSMGQTSEDLSAVPAGNYRVTVYYNPWCDDTISYKVKQPSSAINGLTHGHDVLCFGENNGFVDLTTTGGTPPYAFLWSLNGQTSEDLENLSAGIYTVTIVDSLNCSASKQVIIDEPDPLQVEASPDVTICIGESAVLTGNALGGTPPYTYEWIGVGSAGLITVSPIIETSYYVHVTDNNNCKSDTASVTISLYPSVTSFATVQDDTICLGDSTYVFANFSGGNGGPYSCLLNGEETSIPVYVKPDTTITYTIIGYDDCGSPAVSSSVTVNVMMPTYTNFAATVMEGCQPLKVNFFALGSEPGQTYFWSFEDFDGHDFSYNKTPTHIYETAGVWDVSLDIFTPFGCKFTLQYSDMISVYPKPDANFLANPQTVSIIDPTIHFDNLSYPFADCYWDFGDGNTDSGYLNGTSHTYSDTGQFLVTLMAVSDYGCQDKITLPVKVEDVSEFYVPNAFNPNSSFSENRIFKPLIYGLDTDHYYMIIYDRWGEPIFETFDYYHGWDGRVKNKSIAPIGAYVWIVEFSDVKGKPHREAGSVLVIDN